MKRSAVKWFWVLGVFCLVGLMAGGAVAKTDIIPGGPWLTDNQKVNYTSLASYEELVKKLEQVEKSSKGLVELEVIGQTNQGRDILMAKIGDPMNQAVMMQTQQHGNEPVGTEAALQMVQFLSTGSAKANKILDHLYVLIIVRVNPDGAELWQRYNYDPTAPPRNTSKYIYTSGGVGWDINRYHFSDWTNSPLYAQYLLDSAAYPYPANPVPESVAVMEAYLKYQPIWMVDFHGQGTYVTDEGENVTSSMLWPTAPGVSNDVVDLSRQLCVVMMDRMAEYGFATVNLYPGGPEPGIARNAYGLEGSGSVLVELKGGIGQKSMGMLTKHAFEQMSAILEATADGSVYTVDPERVIELDIGRIPYYKDLPVKNGGGMVEPE
ncbi:MAG: M14 family zinc carboxypeptidase [Desulfobacterales bacterium]